MEKWYSIRGSENDVVQSTRIRLVRNLDEFPFTSRLTLSEAQKLNETVKNIILADNRYSLSYIDMAALTETQAVSLAERFLVSPEFASDTSGRALLLSEDEKISIMLCEEDHVTIQVASSGLDLENTFSVAGNIDDMLDAGAGYAFDKRIGYLTQSPANLGTGMRASLVMHLPALSATGEIPRLSSTVSKLGLALKCFFSDRTTPVGCIYQLSNRVTLGISEDAALKNLRSIAAQIITRERQARETVTADDKYIDKIYRAYGLLCSAYMMTCREFTELASFVRLGGACGIIDADIMKIDELMTDVQPATMNASQGRNLTSLQRDKIRAAEIKKALCPSES